MAAFLDGVDPALLEPPVNVLRLTLHPDGMAGRTMDLAEFCVESCFPADPETADVLRDLAERNERMTDRLLRFALVGLQRIAKPLHVD